MTTEFNYSSLTLDELRTLATSPQVGAIEAMPQAFRTLASKVGEVADLLTHAQSNLPNWWKGTAAEQAAATLGRAAAEAREFHDSALGAATAVSRCASVVAEQQHQMMNVPELPEPGVTDTIVRPATPMEALEAARKDAAYRAAHEQAVQVVNGIAAQYVETREQLASSISPGGENFGTTSTHYSNTSDTAKMEGARTPQSNSPESRGASTLENRSTPRSVAYNQPLADYSPTAYLLSTSTEGPKRLEVGGAGYLHPIETARLAEGWHSLGSKEHRSNLRPTRQASSDEMHNVPVDYDSHRPLRRIDDAIESTFLDQTTYTITPKAFDPQEQKQMRTGSSEGAGLKIATNTRPSEAEHRPADPNHGNLSRSYAEREVYVPHALEMQRDTRPSHSGHATEGGTENASMFPPYSGINGAYRTRQDRGRRPDYLKERKSTWLSDTIAAPPDGILRPDWDE